MANRTRTCLDPFDAWIQRYGPREREAGRVPVASRFLDELERVLRLPRDDRRRRLVDLEQRVKGGAFDPDYAAVRATVRPVCDHYWWLMRQILPPEGRIQPPKRKPPIVWRPVVAWNLRYERNGFFPYPKFWREELARTLTLGPKERRQAKLDLEARVTAGEFDEKVWAFEAAHDTRLRRDLLRRELRRLHEERSRLPASRGQDRRPGMTRTT